MIPKSGNRFSGKIMRQQKRPYAGAEKRTAMGEVIRFPDEPVYPRSGGKYIDANTEPATVIILPVIRIDRGPDGVEPDSGNNAGRRRRRRIAR